MMDQECLKEVVTCAEMARMCGLSRSRFYGLVQEGIMPEPSRQKDTNRPFYTREQQRQCLLVRKTNCGVNGKAVLFYAQRRSEGMMPARRPTPVRPQRTAARPDPVLVELQHGLAQLGMSEIAEARIKNVLLSAFPDGYRNVSPPQLLMAVFRRLREEDQSNE
jgi:hypothetical protein